MVRERVWTMRWKYLKGCGLSYEQALKVWEMFEMSRGFGYEWLSISAKEQLDEVYGVIPSG